MLAVCLNATKAFLMYFVYLIYTAVAVKHCRLSHTWKNKPQEVTELTKSLRMQPFEAFIQTTGFLHCFSVKRQ